MSRDNSSPHFEKRGFQKGVYETGYFEKLHFHFSDLHNYWIKFIHNKITLIYCVENGLNPTSEVQNVENGMFQNALFANGSFPNGGYSCLWALSVNRCLMSAFIWNISLFLQV